jgi:GntR family transcriptional regulator/MocR family aminotransferase
MQLLDLAQKHRFAILEDDYDYDFHYDHAPILPLASHDSQGNVLYMGSVCKTVAPVFRVGYLIGPEQVVEEAARVRRYIDRQGDAVLEHAFARFIAQGHLEGHIRKVSREYKLRRDLAYALLKKEVGAYFDFESPKGGMAFWAVLKAPYQWATIAPKLEKLGLAIGDWTRYDRAQKDHGGIRIGFASKRPEEFVAMVRLLKQGFD